MDPKFLRNQKYAKKNNAVRRRALFPRRVSVRACSARFANAQKHVGQKHLWLHRVRVQSRGLENRHARRCDALALARSEGRCFLETVQLASASAFECLTLSKTLDRVALPLPCAWMASGRFKWVRCGWASWCDTLCTHDLLLWQAAKSHPKNRAKGTPHFG